VAEVGKNIASAKRLLDANKLVGIPTETVYGLAGNAFNEAAVLEIFKVKQRPSFDPLIVHASNLDQIRSFVKEIPAQAESLVNELWPGPLTVLLKKNPEIPDLVTSGLDTVAVRIPRHPLTLSLLNSLDYPLAAPSANPFGYISPTKAIHVNEQLGDSIDYILDGGDCHIGVESTIISFEEKTPTILRLGGQPIERLKELLGEVKINEHSSSQPDAPGMMKSHYAPSKKLILSGQSDLLKKYAAEEIGVLVFGQIHSRIPEANQHVLSDAGNVDEAAKNLFSAMRQLDQKPDIRIIIADAIPNIGLGKAINDRLKRASAE
jgi:L-threonylcarbamoyladenylate synthase